MGVRARFDGCESHAGFAFEDAKDKRATPSTRSPGVRQSLTEKAFRPPAPETRQSARAMEEDSRGQNRTGNPSEVDVQQFIHRTSPRSDSKIRDRSKEMRASAYRWLRADSRSRSQGRAASCRTVADRWKFPSRAMHCDRQTNLTKPRPTVKSSRHCLASIPITKQGAARLARPLARGRRSAVRRIRGAAGTEPGCRDP
jgi:hypothetical protein